MSLPAGQKLGPFEVIGLIGEGGMGEVYRARDARLERDVAIKVLPASVADDRERRARFEREAKAVAALSHPNILAIHDIGESQITDVVGDRPRSIVYAVTELLEGETLRARLAGPAGRTGTASALPIRKATDIAIQIARGLAAAHDRGIVHRDLKPENVFLLADGQVKILDFGLAKPFAKNGADATATAVAMTDPGTVVGTVGYMAPEQIRGQPADARTDLFALGAVLYEMVAGERAFQRETAAETMTAILREDPPELATSRADLSPALDRIVRHSLEKNPAERFQTARDVAFALEALSGSATSASSVKAVTASGRSFSPAIIAAAFAIVGAAGGFALTTWLRGAPEGVPIGFETRVSDPQWITNARFAPDGQTIVYSAAPSGNTPSLFVMRKGAVLPQPLGEPGTHLLSVSRSGELAVLTGARFLNHRLFSGTLSRMTMDGGARPVSQDVREADWAPDGATMAVVRDLGTKDQLEYPAGTTLYEAPAYVSDVRVSPDGSRVAFLDHPARFDDRGWLKVVNRQGVVKTLSGELWGAEGVAWSPDGGTVFVSSATADAFGYHPHAVEVNGDSVLRPAFPSMTSSEMMDVAADGSLLVSAAEQRISVRVLVPGESIERELPWLDLPLPRALSSDGKWLLFTDQSPSAGLNYAVSWRKTDGSPAVRLGDGVATALSPDDRWVISFVPSPAPGHFMAYPTGPGQPMTLDFSPLSNVGSIDFFPDGRLFLCGSEPNKPRRCYRRDLAGGSLEPVTPENISNGSPAPDGRTIGFTTREGVWQLVEIGGGSPRVVPGDHALDTPLGWSRDSRAMFVRAGGTLPAVIDRIDLATGARTRVRELMPPDRLGIMQVFPARIAHDGQAYSYGYWRQMSKAVVVSGVTVR